MTALAKDQYLAQYSNNFLVVPRANCEHWEYLPITFTNKIAAGNYWYISEECDLFQFGVLNSSMYMAWVKCVSGRLQCYDRQNHNPSIKHFPWPISHTQAHIIDIEEKALQVLRVREQFPSMRLADLYNPLTMPEALQNAHRELDKAVDAAYGVTHFVSDDSRIGYLLNLQRKLGLLLINLYADAPVVPEVTYYYDGSFSPNAYSQAMDNSIF